MINRIFNKLESDIIVTIIDSKVDSKKIGEMIEGCRELLHSSKKEAKERETQLLNELTYLENKIKELEVKCFV